MLQSHTRGKPQASLWRPCKQAGCWFAAKHRHISMAGNSEGTTATKKFCFDVTNWLKWISRFSGLGTSLSYLVKVEVESSSLEARVAMAATACSRLTYFASPHEATQLVRPCRCTLLRFKLRHSKGFGLPERKEARSIQSLRASVADGPSTSTSTLVTQDIIFAWKGQASEVLLTGDFLEWQKQVPLEKSPDGTFQIKQKLAPGSYKYKFIVDGQWMHSPDSPTASDGTGGFNNELIVAESAPGKEAPSPPPAKEKPEKPAAKPKPKPKKPAAKTYPALMVEDVAPRLQAKLAKEENLADVEVCFENDQLRGSFSKLGVPYTFWAYFPDASLEGARGFSVSAYGSPPSTVEPFLIDEKKLTADLIVYWVHKRLFAQNLLELN